MLSQGVGLGQQVGGEDTQVKVEEAAEDQQVKENKEGEAPVKGQEEQVEQERQERQERLEGQEGQEGQKGQEGQEGQEGQDKAEETIGAELRPGLREEPLVKTFNGEVEGGEVEGGKKLPVEAAEDEESSSSTTDSGKSNTMVILCTMNAQSSSMTTKANFMIETPQEAFDLLNELSMVRLGREEERNT